MALAGDLLTENRYADYVQRLIAGEKGACQRIVLELLEEGMGVRDLYTHLFQRSMYEVGDLWERHVISVAVEHLTTAITESLMSLLYPRLFSRASIGKTAIVACCANEYHQIGGKMVADMLEYNGWDSYFLGANTPLSDLTALIGEKRPDMVGLSLTIAQNRPVLEKILEALTTLYPDLKILVGGQALRRELDSLLERFPTVGHLANLERLEEWIAQEG